MNDYNHAISSHLEELGTPDSGVRVRLASHPTVTYSEPVGTVICAWIFGAFVVSCVYRIIVRGRSYERIIMILIKKIECFGSVFDVFLERCYKKFSVDLGIGNEPSRLSSGSNHLAIERWQFLKVTFGEVARCYRGLVYDRPNYGLYYQEIVLDPDYFLD